MFVLNHRFIAIAGPYNFDQEISYDSYQKFHRDLCIPEKVPTATSEMLLEKKNFHLSCQCVALK